MNAKYKYALVTGANSGIGLALIKKLLIEGYKVIGTSRSGEISDLSSENLSVIKLDITSKESIEKVMPQIRNFTERIDLLINNAGVAPDVFSIEPEVKSFEETFATNVNGTVFFTELMLSYLNNGSQIIFISSNMALPRNLALNGPAYRMSKAAINTYAIMLSKRLAEKNIRVIPMHPGWVQTRLGGTQAPYTPQQSAEKLFQGMITNTESGKFWNVEISAIEEY